MSEFDNIEEPTDEDLEEIEEEEPSEDAVI